MKREMAALAAVLTAATLHAREVGRVANGRDVEGTRYLPDDPAYLEWRGPSVHARTGAANAWSVLAADPERDLVFVPAGSAATDYYGGPRLGDNRCANSLVAPSRLPCTPPAFGSLVAVDLKTGAIRWNVPLGSLGRLLPPELADKVSTVSPDWGSPNLGGPIVTAGGLVFIGAGLDRFLRAFDIETGRELWKGPLPESGKATPMSYRLASGDQFVAIAAGGGGAWGAGDHVIAFRVSR